MSTHYTDAQMKTCLTIVGIAALFVGIGAGLYGHDGLPWAGILGCSVCLIFANLDRLESFKASRDGFEAKTRAVIKEAENTLAELQILAMHLAGISLALVKRSGRIGGYQDDEEEGIKKEMLATLSKIGIDDSEFPRILAQWHRFEALDYVFGVMGNSHIPTGVAQEVIGEWKALVKEAAVSEHTEPEALRSFLERNGLMTSARHEYLLDYEHFLATKTHRRPDVWSNRRHWGHLQAVLPGQGAP